MYKVYKKSANKGSLDWGHTLPTQHPLIMANFFVTFSYKTHWVNPLRNNIGLFRYFQRVVVKFLQSMHVTNINSSVVCKNKSRQLLSHSSVWYYLRVDCPRMDGCASDATGQLTPSPLKNFSMCLLSWISSKSSYDPWNINFSNRLTNSSGFLC